ncbi:MAG: MtrB/PioB family outer membrane beta-barrel protein [Ignavibacteriales bacterium]|nr:MtrB/PioB family outer membrane beta-barrel protein [Ignavibacteriales bacterium]
MKTTSYSVTTILLGSIVAFQALAQDQVQMSGEQTPGLRQIGLSTNSSKFNEYRDLRDGFYVNGLRLDFLQPEDGWFLDFKGEKLLRDDQNIFVRLGSLTSRWNVVIDHNETPHHLSNKAMTPYINRGGGLFTVSAQVPIIKDADTTNGTPSLVPTVGQMAINDAIISKYLETYLRPVGLTTQRDRTTATLNVMEVGGFNFRLSYLNERRNGTRVTYGPLGDRPPRTMNIQIPEPVDYTTQEIHAGADYVETQFQVQLNYLYSMFDNRIDVLRWENIYFDPDAGLDYIATLAGTPRNVSNFGQRALAPDNFSHTFSLSAGFDLPLDSRLTTTAVVALLRQNEVLLPYSASTLGGNLTGDGLSWNDPKKLPRDRAGADMQTIRFDLDYTMNPFDQLNVRPFVRYYKLKNNTPTERWQYVTQDASNTNGSVNIKNKVLNHPYAFDKLKFGLDVRNSFSSLRTTLGVGFARESINRDFREAATDENIFELSVRTRPFNTLSLAAEYRFGDRRSDKYDYKVTNDLFWYTFAEGANDVDNPQFLFGNHPDLRRFDVTDRKRNEVKFSTAFVVFEGLDLNASYRYRNDDFASDVGPVAPLAGTTVTLPTPADANALTPGKQLGLLGDKRQNFLLNIQFVPAEQWTINTFVDREQGLSDQRGLVFNENFRNEPSEPTIQGPTALGPWTDPGGLYDARTMEATNTVGVGIACEIIPSKLRLLTDFSLSLATVDIEYSGFGSDPAELGRAWETFAFGFNDPGTIKYSQSVVNASLDYNVVQNLVLGLHYLYSRYVIQDWVQEPVGPWVERVGSEFMLRDSSRDERWGNRLVSMGSYLAPSYEAHVGYLTMTYRF